MAHGKKIWMIVILAMTVGGMLGVFAACGKSPTTDSSAGLFPTSLGFTQPAALK